MMRPALFALFMVSGVGMANDPTPSTLSGPEYRAVVSIEPPGAMTAHQRRRICNELEAGLKAAWPSARVSVIDLVEHPPAQWLSNWRTAMQSRFSELGPAPAPQRGKTHYIRLDADGERWRIATRQWDDDLAFASPVIRQSETNDRAFLARLVLLDLAKDLGPTARMIGSDGENAARMALGPGVRWVQSGDVFALVAVSGPNRSRLVPSTYIRATNIAKTGEIDGELVSRFVLPMAGVPLDSLRGIRLGTEKGPLHILVLDGRGQPLSNLMVRVSGTGFRPTDSIVDRGVTKQGHFQSTQSFDRIAFVTIANGDKTLVQTPAAILGGGPTMIEVNLTPAGEKAAQLGADLRGVRGRLDDLWLRLVGVNEQLRSPLGQARNAEALSMVSAALRPAEAELPRHSVELDRLRQAGRSIGDLQGLDDCDQVIRNIRGKLESFKKLEGELQAALRAADSPEMNRERDQLQALVRQADLECDDGEYDKAIATLKTALARRGDWQEVRNKLGQLEREWATKDETHRQARAAIIATAGKALDPTDLEKSLPDLKQAFLICRNNGDRLTPRKLYMSLTRSAPALARGVEQAVRAASEDERARAEPLKKLAAETQALMADIDRWIRSSP